jgi:uncharacterized membrane protein HdeD (DUF308 family)
MASNVSSPYLGATPSRHTGTRIAVGALGIAALVVGIVLLFNPVAAARSLAWLLGLALALGGLLEIAVGWDSGRRASSIVLGGILVLGGLLAVSWPGATLWVLAVITGLSLITHGVVRMVVSVVARHEIPSWGWLALAGAVNVVLGVLAIAWPEATVFVLSVIFGAQIAGFGVLLLVAAFVKPGRAPASAA